MTLDYRSAIQEKLSAKKQELTETHESLKKYSTFNPLQPHYGNNVGQNRSNLFRNRLGPATNGANTMGGRLGPKVSATDSATTRTQQQTSAAGMVPSSSICFLLFFCSKSDSVNGWKGPLKDLTVSLSIINYTFMYIKYVVRGFKRRLLFKRNARAAQRPASSSGEKRNFDFRPQVALASQLKKSASS